MNYKGVDFEKRLSSVEEADKLLSELKTCQVNADSTADQLWEIRTACDRILRACNTQLGKSRSCPLLFQRVLLIAELACQGYTAAVTQRTELYLEKILFHFMKNVAAQDAYDECSKFADLLYSLLGSCKLSEEHVKDYVAIAKSCFGILWKGADGVAKSGQWTLLESRKALCCRFRAVRFLVLLEAKDLVSSPGELSSSGSQTSRHVVAAVAIFEAQQTPFANEDVLFLSDQMFCLLIRPLMEVICRPDQMTAQQALCLIDLTVERCRRLCKRDCIREAQEAIKQSQLYLAQVGFNEALELCQLGVALQQASSSSPLLQQATEAICRFMESNGGRWEFLTESTQFFVSVIDRRSKRTEGAGFALTDFLYLWAFLEQRAKLLNKQKARVPTDCLKQQRNLKAQLYSCYQLYTAVIFNFFQNAQDLKPVVLVDLLKTCTDTVNRMLDELDGFSAKDQAEYFNVTALCAFNLAYGFYNQKMYSESSDIMGILCERFCSAAPVQDCMPFEKLHKYFRIQAESCRKAGFFQKASRVIALWLTALKEKITEELEDPVSLWVRVKMDALKGGDEDLRLKTLKDCLADSNVKPLEPSILVILLSEELKAYRTVHADTGQERYNVICDLLEICSEESELLHERGVYLVELAKVLCYHDYSNQADCSALDSVQEALRLLEALPKTPGNTEQLMDDQAHALLWLFICTIESKMQASMAKEQYTGNNQAQVKKYLQVFEPNDLNYEDKLQEDKFTYAGIDFNLVADSVQSKCLDEALEVWKKLFSAKQKPKLRHTEQTVTSLLILGALYHLMGKPLQSIESCLLARGLSDAHEDHLASVNALCHVAKTLFLIRCPEYAKIYVEEAESRLSYSSPTSDTYLLMKLTCESLRSQLYCDTGKVKEGVTLLLGILKNPSLHKSSKAWYLLRSRILQLLASYLQLPASCLSSELRLQLWEQGWMTPETALTDAHKLLRSILLLLGNSGFTPKTTTDTRFVDHGDNLLLKWQVFGDLLSCSHDLVFLLSRVGSVSEAKSFCLEALKVCVMLQAVRQCAGFLVTKAELELQCTESETCQLDLQQVLFLLESGTVFKMKSKGEKVQIKLKKGKALKNENPAGPVASPEDEGFLICPSMVFMDIEAVDKLSAQTSSPVLKSEFKKQPGFLLHTRKCTCSLCSDIALSILCIRWAMAFSEMQGASGSQADSSRVLRSALKRCAAFTPRFSNALRNTLSKEQRHANKEGMECLTTRLADGLLAQIYARFASSSAAGNSEKAIIDYIQVGLHFMTVKGVQGLEHSKADLLMARAVTSLYSLASKNGSAIQDLFSQKWVWNPPSSCLSDTKKLNTKPSEIKTSVTGSLPVMNGEDCVLSFTKKSKPLGLKKLAVQLPDFNDAFSLDNLDTEMPTIAIKPIFGLTTPVQKCFPAAIQPKTSFTIFNESELPKNKRLIRAPKASKKIKSRLKVVFSDESEPEEQEPATKPDTLAPKSKSDSQAPCGRGRTGRKTVSETYKMIGRSQSNEPDICGSVDVESNTVKPVGRTTRARAQALQEEVEILRGVSEEEAEVFEISFEALRGSDGEEKKSAKGRKKSAAVRDGADGECEVLRRDSSFNLLNCFSGVEQNADQNSFNMQGLSNSLQSTISASDVDAVYKDLKDAFYCICHFPPSALYAQLCQLMALCLGSQDPYTTAYLVSESVAVTTRHQLISNIHRKLRKKKKNGSFDISDGLQDLVLDDGGNAVRALHLTQLENLFQFTCSGLNTDDFREQLQLIPKDVVVCLLTRVDPHPGAMGDTLLLTRLEKCQTPITMRIPTAQSKVSLSSALREFDAIQKEQKEVGSLTDKLEWWEGRSGLDRRMKLLIESLEHHVLGCWKGLLLPSCSEASIGEEAHLLSNMLRSCGLNSTNSELLLKAILNGSHLLSKQHVKILAFGLCQAQPEQAQALLQTAVDKLKTLTGTSSGHIVLVLDKHLQKLPWECLPSLIERSVTRLPSLRFLLTYGLVEKFCSQSTVAHGVNPDSTYYVLNPHANLPGTEERFRDWFESESKWSGVIGKVPRPEQIQTALTKHDLYIYAGHGAGAHFLDGQSILKLDCNAVSLLFGCSSAALGVRGKLEGAGIILKYLIAGCPLVVGNLWDVTDRDLDRYMESLLKSWLKAGSGASILPYIAQSRRAPKLKYLIGAAPIAYGMPVKLR